MLDLTIFSHADDPYTVEVGVFRDESSRSDARVYSASLDVPSEGRAERENVLEARPYLVRYSAYRDNSRLTDEGHVHYLPPEDGEAGLTFDIDSDGSLTRR